MIAFFPRRPRPPRIDHSEFAEELNQRIHQIIEQILAIRQTQHPLLEDFGLSHQTELLLVRGRLYEEAINIIKNWKLNEFLQNPRTPQKLPKTLLEFYKTTTTNELCAFAKKMS